MRVIHHTLMAGAFVLAGMLPVRAEPPTHTFTCVQAPVNPAGCDGDPEICERTFHCALRIYREALDPTKTYTGVFAQINGPGSDWQIVPQYLERIPVSGYTIATHGDRNNSHIGGDFGYVFDAPADHNLPYNTALAANVHNAWGDPGPFGFRGGTGLTIVLGSSGPGLDTGHGSAAIAMGEGFLDSGAKWYRGLHLLPDSIHPNSPGAIWFERSSAANFVTIQPSDDIDNTAIRIVDSWFTQSNLDLRKSGRVLTRRSTGYCATPAFGFVDDPDTGICSPFEDMLTILSGGVPKVTVRPRVVEVGPDMTIGGQLQIPNVERAPRSSRAACFDAEGRLFRSLSNACP
jgi:hypothetical protein